MTNRAITGTALSLAIALATLACSSSPSRPIAERADGRAQEVREDANEIPCDVRTVLETVCQQCHALSPRGGAPFPLVRRSDVLGLRAGAVVRDLMIQQLDARRMPLTPVTIEPAAREVLLGWLRAGAPAVTPRACDGEVVDGGTDADPTDASTTTDSSNDCSSSDTCFDAHIDDVSDASDASEDATPE
jgi:hypothetical protein